MDELKKSMKTKQQSTQKFMCGKTHHTASIVGEILGIIIGTVVILYIFPLLPFVTSSYVLYAPIGLGAIFLTGISKIGSHIIRITPIVRILRIAANVISLYSTYMLRQIYPFDFARIGMASLNDIFYFALLIALFALVLAIVVETVKLFFFAPLEK